MTAGASEVGAGPQRLRHASHLAAARAAAQPYACRHTAQEPAETSMLGHETRAAIARLHAAAATRTIEATASSGSAAHGVDEESSSIGSEGSLEPASCPRCGTDFSFCSADDCSCLERCECAGSDSTDEESDEDERQERTACDGCDRFFCEGHFRHCVERCCGGCGCRYCEQCASHCARCGRRLCCQCDEFAHCVKCGERKGHTEDYFHLYPMEAWSDEDDEEESSHNGDEDFDEDAEAEEEEEEEADEDESEGEDEDDDDEENL